MTNTGTPRSETGTIMNSVETQQLIENHKKIATHLETAAKKHMEAAKQHGEGNHEEAVKSAAQATNHMRLASEAQQAAGQLHNETDKK